MDRKKKTALLLKHTNQGQQKKGAQVDATLRPHSRTPSCVKTIRMHVSQQHDIF
jgi:hypothetical protein